MNTLPLLAPFRRSWIRRRTSSVPILGRKLPLWAISICANVRRFAMNPSPATPWYVAPNAVAAAHSTAACAKGDARSRGGRWGRAIFSLCCQDRARNIAHTASRAHPANVIHPRTATRARLTGRLRSEERRVGKEARRRGSRYDEEKDEEMI